MFKKFFKFLRGYVIIEIYGAGAGRFVNICLSRNIPVWDMFPCENGIRLRVFTADFMLLRSVARKTRVKVKIIKKAGLARTARLYRGRYMFMAGLAACILFCAVSSQFIWLVEIDGVENSDINGIRQTLDSLGIKSGALKRSLPEGMDIKNAIVNGNDGVVWAWLYIDGAKARVEIYEQRVPPAVLKKDAPCDIVAARSGIVKTMTVKGGEEAVREGDAVSAGDVLVSGSVAVFKEGYPEEYMLTRAIARVDAYTAHKKSGDYKLYYESRTPTGRKKTMYSIELFGKMFSLPVGEIKFENYDVKESRHELYIPFFGYAGIAFDTVRYSEIDLRREQLSTETAVEFAKNDMEEKIAKELTVGAVLTDENIEYKKINNDTINVQLEMNFIENIAVEQTIEDKGEEIFDKQADRDTTDN